MIQKSSVQSPTPIGGVDTLDIWAAVHKVKKWQFGHFGLFADHAIFVTPFMKSSEKSLMEQYLFTLGGKICCVRCNATSKRTKQQCMAPAIKGKAKCRIHGGKSTGPKTANGKARCTEAKTVHGWETRQGRIERGEAMRRLRQLEGIGHALEFISGGRIPGRKPRN